MQIPGVIPIAWLTNRIYLHTRSWASATPWWVGLFAVLVGVEGEEGQESHQYRNHNLVSATHLGVSRWPLLPKISTMQLWTLLRTPGSNPNYSIYYFCKPPYITKENIALVIWTKSLEEACSRSWQNNTCPVNDGPECSAGCKEWQLSSDCFPNLLFTHLAILFWVGPGHIYYTSSSAWINMIDCFGIADTQRLHLGVGRMQCSLGLSQACGVEKGLGRRVSSTKRTFHWLIIFVEVHAHAALVKIMKETVNRSFLPDFKPQ